MRQVLLVVVAMRIRRTNPPPFLPLKLNQYWTKSLLEVTLIQLQMYVDKLYCYAYFYDAFNVLMSVWKIFCKKDPLLNVNGLLIFIQID